MDNIRITDRPAMGVRRFGRVNWLGTRTLATREVMRFMAVWQQTIFAPLMTAALFVLVLALLLASAVLAMRPGTPEYGAAVIWALVGVAVGNLEPMNPAVLGLAAAGIAGLGVMMWRTA